MEPAAHFSVYNFYPQDGGCIFLRDVVNELPDYTWSHSKRQQLSSPSVQDPAAGLCSKACGNKDCRIHLQFMTQVHTNSEGKVVDLPVT